MSCVDAGRVLSRISCRSIRTRVPVAPSILFLLISSVLGDVVQASLLFWLTDFFADVLFELSLTC